jgi:hypothetical protein
MTRRWQHCTQRAVDMVPNRMPLTWCSTGYRAGAFDMVLTGCMLTYLSRASKSGGASLHIGLSVGYLLDCIEGYVLEQPHHWLDLSRTTTLSWVQDGGSTITAGTRSSQEYDSQLAARRCRHIDSHRILAD